VYGQWKSREELIQLLVYTNEDSFYGCDHALGDCRCCVVDYLVLICKRWDVGQGMQGVCLLVFRCMVGSCHSG